MDIEALVRAPGTPIALAAFRRSASDPDLRERLGLVSQDMPPQRDPEEWGIRPVWMFKGVRIDPVAGRYFYRFEPDVGPQESHEWEMLPWDPEGSPDFGKVLNGTVHALKVKANQAWLIIADRFQRALLDGTIVVAGRSRSPTAEITAVPKEAWGHFQVLDWTKGYAETEHGDRLYGLQIAASESSAEEAEKPSRSGWRGRQAKEIINQLYPNGSHTSLTDKELTEAVRIHLLSVAPNLRAPSKRTVRRASGREE